MDQDGILQDKWIAEYRARWAAHRAANSVSTGDYDLRYLELIMCLLGGSNVSTPRPGAALPADSGDHQASDPVWQYPPNTRIPTESELVETYEVARSTARRAVAALREEGLVYTVQARGTYVAEQGNRTKQATGS